MGYTPVHGCNKGPCKQQVITILIFIAQLALHSVFVVPGIFDVNDKLQKDILIIILAFFYALLLLICYDYLWISCHDPADRILFYPDRMQGYALEELDDCSQCGKKQITSYHCNRCGRCTEDFDHHCKFLNSCIGGLNYENFLRLLLTNIIYNLVCIGQGAWIFVLP